MAPIIGEQDEFEGVYTEAFRSLARPYGEFVTYERDRAAIDFGLHLTNRDTEQHRAVTQSRVWFQLKGIRSSTLQLQEYEASSDVSLDLRIEDLMFWYASPETVYLAVYIESADTFLVEDVRDVVDRRWPGSIFSPGAVNAGQKTARVTVSRAAKLGPQAWERMAKHRSMRIDGPSFRGRPLGHRLDPLRSRLSKMEPQVFEEVVDALLLAHGYEVKQMLAPVDLFGDLAPTADIASLWRGVLHYTYEWVLQMTTEIGFDEGSRYRIEGDPLYAQGPCAVLIHSRKASLPRAEAVHAFALSLARDGVGSLLVFANDHGDPRYFGTFVSAVRDTEAQCAPQHLGDLAFNLLVATNVYLEFRDSLSWDRVCYL